MARPRAYKHALPDPGSLDDDQSDRHYLELATQILCPTLLIAGAQDQVCPIDRHQEIFDRIDHACMRVVEQCGHISTLEQPEFVSAALLELLAQPSGRITRSGNCQLKILETPN